ncbi:MAG: hypothetical protein JNL98_07090 [Bryobacterales bacterium]|nr:hypothetical protein [Bryobacterales bacterium]
MNCGHAQDQLLDGGFGGQDLTGHLASCAECRRFAASVEAVDAAFHRLRIVLAPPTLKPNVLLRAKLEQGLRRRLITLALDTLAAAGCVAALAAVLFWIYPQPAVTAFALVLGCLWAALFRGTAIET